MSIQNAVTRLDAIWLKAQNDSWTEMEQGEMAVLVLQLEYEWGKYLRDEYGDTIFNLFLQITGVWYEDFSSGSYTDRADYWD